MNPGRRATLAALLLAILAGWEGTAARALAFSHGPRAHSARSADSPARGKRENAGTSRAPSGPPLTGSDGSPRASGGEAGAVSQQEGEVDPLVSNGLGSPLCKRALGEVALSASSRRDCETSGFIAAGAPTGHYGIDVHIDTGILGFTALTAVQDLFVTPVWMALVWAVHALVVMLEWCFTIDLLDKRSLGGVASGLRRMQTAITEPWLATVFAVASVLALYNGLIRRRVVETVGEALLMLAMTAGGMWLIVDPAGTVGALGGWANQASLQTLAATVQGTPAGAGRALADSMGTVFNTAVEVPWCYLEFGDVGWCRNPARLDPRLHSAALAIAARELAQAGCKPTTDPVSSCVAQGSAQTKALEHSAALLRDAHTNGAIFLALPPNGPARNSINEGWSLLRIMCQSGEATRCRGPTASQAEFRTNGGTWSRVGGLVLIVAGVLGMLMLLGFIAVRLLAAASFSLLYLLLAPAVVLAPALGDGGRALFRKWAGRLLGALVAKLLFSFLLGAVLAIFAILASLEALGWWTQWLLMSAFWWGAYAHRHQALAISGGPLARASGHRSLAKRVSDALDPRRTVIGAARVAKDRLSKPAPRLERGHKLARASQQRARAGLDEQVRQVLEREHGEAREQAEGTPEVQARLSAQRAQLERVRNARHQALAAGDTRRAAKLGYRAERIAEGLAHGQEALNAARHTVRAGARARRESGGVYSSERAAERSRFLDAQAALPDMRARTTGERRDYAALAGLAGYGREHYERLDPHGQRLARLEVDRELALRLEMGAAARDVAVSGAVLPIGRRERGQAERAFARSLEQRMRDGGHSMPSSRARSWLEGWRAEARTDARTAPGRESSVMRDALEVASRRKRQLGRDRD